MEINYVFILEKTNNRRGVVYIMTMALLVLFNSAALTFLTMARSDGKIIETQIDSIRAFYNAESAAAKSISEFIGGVDSDSNGIGTIAPVDYDFDSKIDYQAVYVTTGGNNEIQATGYSGNAQRTVILRVSFSPFTILSWKGNNVS